MTSAVKSQSYDPLGERNLKNQLEFSQQIIKKFIADYPVSFHLMRVVQPMTNVIYELQYNAVLPNQVILTA